MNINDFSKLGYKGIDQSLNESLFKYGFIYSYEDPKSNGDLRVWYKVSGTFFDWVDFKKDLDVRKEFKWVDFKSIQSFMDLIDEEFNDLELHVKINYMAIYYGTENIYGTPYYPTEILEAV